MNLKKTVLQSRKNFDDGLVLMVKLYDMIPEVKDDIIPFLVDLSSSERIDDELRAEIEAKILNNSLNFKDRSISIPCILKKDENGYCLYTINKTLRKSFSSLIEIRMESPWELIDINTKVPLWFIKAVPGFLDRLELKKEQIYFFKNILIEEEKEYSEVELEYPFI